jgi:hypothetical protein
MRQGFDRLGKTSLILFLLGLLLFGLELYGVRFSPSWFTSRVFYRTYAVAVVLELTAAGFGLAGRDSGAARLGLGLSLLTLTLLVGFCCSLFALLGGSTGVHG